MKFVLVVVDGLGLRDSERGNAFRLAGTPTLDHLLETFPWTRLEASGPAVGLPDGVIGNSEVGHMTIGAGRIIKHDLVRINDAIKTGEFERNGHLGEVFSHVRRNQSALHFLGLVSDAGVHSHIEHLFAILKAAGAEGIDRLYLHAITDGRDTSPRSGVRYVKRVMERMSELRTGSVATVVGRYFGMDRDKRWDRTERAYRAMVAGEGAKSNDPVSAIEDSYARGATDEFIEPIVIDSRNGASGIEEKDALICFNFRADRMRQITRALGGESFDEFPRLTGPVFTTTMTSYDDTFSFPVMFNPVSLGGILGEVLAEAGFHQLRVAETEKYAHVTYFFNGGDETPFPGEERILVPSQKVATYDKMPEMSAKGIRDTVLEAVHAETCDAIIMNIANPDMVGHSGNLEAAIRAVEVADGVIGDVVTGALDKGAAVFITADHGNAEMMETEDGSEEHTAHTLNPVPFILVSPDRRKLTLNSGGGLADIAPTILDYMGISIPPEMTGNTLITTR